MLRAGFFLAIALVLPAVGHAANEEMSIPVKARVTCYAPGAGGNIEGPFATSRPGPNGAGSVPKTLDDFRLGKSKYVTLAAHPSHYGKYYDMGSITYVSNADYKRYTIEKVIGYVHDTGSAFRESGCAKYGTCAVMRSKYDIAYGDYRKGGNQGLVNSGSVCGNTTQQWRQIGGPLTSDPVVSGGEYVPSAAAGYAPPGGGQAQSIGQAYQSNQGGQQYPQAMPSQQAQPVYQPGGAQPGQYFSPLQTGAPTPYSSGLSTLSPISLTGEGGTSVADKLLSLLGVSTTPTLSSVAIGKSTGGSAISVETSGGKFEITSTDRPGITYTSGSTTVSVEKREGDTFGAGVNYSASSTNTTDPLFNILLRFRDILSGILQSLRELVGQR